MKLSSFFSHTFGLALPALVGVALIAGVAYINEQQTWRMMANEPQEWLAQSAANTAVVTKQAQPAAPVTNTNDASSDLGIAAPGDVAPAPQQTTHVPQATNGEKIAIERDEAPYTILYDAKRTAVSGTGYLHGVLPQIPDGIFDTVDHQGVDRLTWQPEPGVRQAIVVLPIKTGSLTGGYALAGRSLAYTEWQETQLMHRWLLGLVGTLVAILLVSGLITYIRSRRILGA